MTTAKVILHLDIKLWKSVAMFKVLPKPLPVSHIYVDGLFGTTKACRFQLLPIMIQYLAAYGLKFYSSFPH